MTTIQARGLSKTYSGTVAVDDLAFDVQPGGVTGFLGPNGAGKSTTIRLMLGLDSGGGETRFDGKRYADLTRPLTQVGTLLEAKAFHPTRTARNHLRVLAASNGLPRRRADEVLELVGLTGVAGKKPRTFSLGMGQRLGLAAALLGDPQALILDEPANGLDPAGINWLRTFLKDFARRDRAVFVSSHLLAEMALMADHLVVIGRGRLIAAGPVEDFITSASGNAVVVRAPDIGALRTALERAGLSATPTDDGGVAVTGTTQEAVGDIAFEAGVRVHELRSRVASLEEAFLEATAGSEEFHTALDFTGSSETMGDAGGEAMTGALNYEIARLRTLRSTWWLLGISLVVTAAIATAIALVARTNDLDMEYFAVSLTGGADFSPIPLPAVFAGLVGVFAFGHEYRYGTIRPALAAIPHRATLMAAKLIITSLWAIVIAVLNVAVGYLVLLIVPGQELRSFGLPWDAVGRPVVGFVLLVLMWNAVGLSFGGLFRNMPAAIVALLVIPLVVESILFAVLQFVPALDDVSWLAKYLPFGAGAAMATVFTPDDFDQGSDIDVATPLQGGLTFAIFALALLTICLVLFRRRDA